MNNSIRATFLRAWLTIAAVSRLMRRASACSPASASPSPIIMFIMPQIGPRQ